MGSIWYNRKIKYPLSGVFYPLLPLENEDIDKTLPPVVNEHGVKFNYKNEWLDRSYNASNIRRKVVTARISTDADCGLVVGGWVKLQGLGAEYGDMLEILNAAPYLSEEDQARVALFPQLQNKLTVKVLDLG